MFTAVSRLVRGNSKRKKGKGTRLKRRTYQPRVDALEPRNLLATLFVDDDLVQEPTAAFTSIQAAIDAASAGDTIRVSPGIYEEAITVDESVSLIGAGASVADAEDPLLASIVDVELPFQTGFNVLADRVTIRGFTIGDLNGSPTANTNITGILTNEATSGHVITGNVFEHNTIGLYPNTSGELPTLVMNNTFVNNDRGGAAAHTGIYTDRGSSNIRFLGNRFAGNDNAAIILSGFGEAVQENITIAGNSMRDGGIVVLNASDVTIIGNRITDATGDGIQLLGGVSDMTIAGNIVTGSAATAINVADEELEIAPEANTDVQIIANLILNSGDTGIRLTGATNSSVRGNTVIGSRGDDEFGLESGSGIAVVGGSLDNTISGNLLLRNANSGIFVEEGSVDNVLRLNFGLLNGQWDFFDDSTGGGTAGTGNTWQGNFGLRSQPAGLRGGGGLFGGLIGALGGLLGGLFG